MAKIFRDAALGAEIEHLLRFPGAADAGSGEPAPLHKKPEGGDRQWLFRSAHQRQRSVPLQQIDVRV
jgi:hypothetical protein